MPKTQTVRKGAWTQNLYSPTSTGKPKVKSKRITELLNPTHKGYIVQRELPTPVLRIRKGLEELTWGSFPERQLD